MRASLMLTPLCLLAACQSLPPVATLQLPQGPVSYVMAGKAQPAVVLQAGLGDGKAVWGDVFAALAREHQVIAYDRPGYGASARVQGARDACSIAAEQQRVLQAAGVRPPYILVGHSLGGLYQYVFARMYPDQVAALVLVDPTHPRHWETMQREVPNSAAMLKKAGSVLFSATAQREFDDQAACLERFDLRAPLTVPARLLTSTVSSALAPREFSAMAQALATDWVRISGAPEQQQVSGAGHYIQNQRPQAVIDAVLSVRRAAGEKNAASLRHSN